MVTAGAKFSEWNRVTIHIATKEPIYCCLGCSGGKFAFWCARRKQQQRYLPWEHFVVVVVGKRDRKDEHGVFVLSYRGFARSAKTNLGGFCTVWTEALKNVLASHSRGSPGGQQWQKQYYNIEMQVPNLFVPALCHCTHLCKGITFLWCSFHYLEENVGSCYKFFWPYLLCWKKSIFLRDV